MRIKLDLCPKCVAKIKRLRDELIAKEGMSHQKAEELACATRASEEGGRAPCPECRRHLA